MRAGYASDSETPSPAVRLVPRKTATGLVSVVDAVSEDGEMDADRPASAPSSPVWQARPAASRAVASILWTMMIEASGLTQTYLSGGRPLTVLKDISFAVEPQGFVAVIGPSGSGKTTLLGLLAGLDQPTHGTVKLDGQDLALLTEDQRAKFRADRIGFVFQSFQLIPTLTAFENVMVPMELKGAPNGRQGAAKVAADLLAHVGLGDRLEHYPTQLSGGEQQRVALARAFANRPKILFADEPTGNLDANTGHKIIDLMVDLNREAATTLVLVTHDPELAARARRVIRLSGGEVVEDTTKGNE